MSRPQDDVTAYPLQWPPGRKRTASNARQRANYGKQQSESRQWGDGRTTTWKSRKPLTIPTARDRLRDELGRLGATQVVISTNLQLRLDGEVRGGQSEPTDPGVAAYFVRDGQRLCIAVDVWDRAADNLAAVAKAIESIRGLERVGGGGMVQAAFTGFKALPGGDALVTPAPMTVEAAADFVAINGGGEYGRGSILAKPDAYRFDYRVAAAKLHPDRNGGQQRPEWHTLQQAKSVLDKHHGL